MVNQRGGYYDTYDTYEQFLQDEYDDGALNGIAETITDVINDEWVSDESQSQSDESQSQSDESQSQSDESQSQSDESLSQSDESQSQSDEEEEKQLGGSMRRSPTSRMRKYFTFYENRITGQHHPNVNSHRKQRKNTPKKKSTPKKKKKNKGKRVKHGGSSAVIVDARKYKQVRNSHGGMSLLVPYKEAARLDAKLKRMKHKITQLGGSCAGMCGGVV